MSRGLRLPGVAALGLLAAWPAYADKVAVVDTAAPAPDATASTDDDSDDQGPSPQQVHVELAGTTLAIVARFELVLTGPFSEEPTILTLPSTAMVTHATATIGNVKHALQLTDADAAQTELDAVLEDAPSSDRKSMIMLSGRDQSLTVDSAFPARTHVLLDMRLEMPTCFYRDVRYALLPKKWFEKLDVARAHVEDDDNVTSACAPAGASGNTEWLAFASRELAKKPPGDGRLGAIGGRLALDERHLARVELDLSRELSVAPADLHTAILIDHSRSVTADEREAERAIIASYLQHAPPHSRVQVIGYTRSAKALLPDWMPAQASAPRIDREIRALPPRNGSNIDAAIAEAANWLARAKGTRRLILFTDDRQSERIEAIKPVAFKRALPAGTLVHVVSVFDGRDGLRRNDETPLAPLAMATDGLAVSGGPDDQGHVDATMLVRPISVDEIRIQGAGWTRLPIGDNTCPSDDEEDPGSAGLLGEGQSCAWWGTGDAVAGPITVEGLIWGRRISRVVRPDPSAGLGLARLLSSSNAFVDNEDETLQALVDRAALAVNNAWSMVGSWGGRGGYADAEAFGFGSLSGGSWGGSSDDFGIGTIGHGGIDPPLDLRKQLAPVVQRCEPRDAHFTLTVETTDEEIVDVGFARTSGVIPASLQNCLVEGVWELSLSIPNAPFRTKTPTEF